MIKTSFQQRYLTDRGPIIIEQENIRMSEGDPVYLEDGSIAPDHVYNITESEVYKYIDVREGQVHQYVQKGSLARTDAQNTFLLLLLLIISLFIISRVIN